MEDNNELMTRNDILGLLTELLVEDVSLSELEKGEIAIDAYRNLLDQPTELDELDDIIPDIIEQFRAKQKGLIREAENKVRQANLKEKEAVIEELRGLIQDEENIGKAFSNFNLIRDKWEAIGDIPQDQYGRVQTEYSKLRESFFYTINIYKELADHDKRVNLRQKQELVEHVRALQTEQNLQSAEKKIRELIKRWDNIGATFPQDWERVKDEFWTGARAIMSKVDAHYEGIRTRQKEKLEQKKALIKQVSDISEKPREKTKEWNDATEKVLAIQADWKKIGFSKDNESAWTNFRSVCDQFFQAKQAHFDKLGAVYDDRKAKKERLIEQSAILAVSEDWRNTATALQDLQRQWKEIGPASQRDENKLWKQFRSNCDSFFNARNKNFKARDKEEKENLKVKEDIINRLKQFTLSGDRNTDMQRLKEFSNQWNDAGHVPFKVKDKVYKTYKTILDGHYDGVKLDANEKRKFQMQSRVASLKNDPQSANREKTRIRRQIDTLVKDNRQYENNLGFFNNPTPDNPLVKEVYKKMRQNENRIKELKEMLKMID